MRRHLEETRSKAVWDSRCVTEDMVSLELTSGIWHPQHAGLCCPGKLGLDRSGEEIVQWLHQLSAVKKESAIKIHQANELP